jgi:ABC-type transporter Mla subunit MlaD
LVIYILVAVSPKLRTLINRLNQELAETEQEASDGLVRVRKLLSQFSDNAQMIQFFAYFSTVLAFVENSKRRIQVVLQGLATDEASAEEIQEAGEDLSTLLGQAIETKIEVRRILTRLRS